MQELSDADVCRLAEERLELPAGTLQARALGGGVSNQVWLLYSDSTRLVVKQALPKLRVKEDWFSDISRIHREAESLRKLAEVLERGDVPRVLFEDRGRYLYAMEAAPAERTWKDFLLAGDVDVEVAKRVGGIHARMISATWEQENFRASFADLEAFDQLRLDPYYRFTRERHPDRAAWFDMAIGRATNDRHCLVHGDWSPKNIMVHNGSVMAIDFEVIHFGDPSFDCAFLLNHLFLKSLRRPECASLYCAAAVAYWTEVISRIPADLDWVWRGVQLHLPALMLSRIDGKSPVEYLAGEGQPEQVRRTAFRLMDKPAAAIEEVFA